MRLPIFLAGAVLLLGGLSLAQETEAERERSLALIKKLGGSYQADQNAPGKPIVMLDLSGTPATDADVALLKGLTRLRALNLNLTKITDAGLLHLMGMTHLEELGLGLTAVGDVGMARLKTLAKLQRMDLRRTKLTDVGLAHLKVLKELQVLDVDGTQVTDAGVKDFQKALPKADVIRQKKPKPMR